MNEELIEYIDKFFQKPYQKVLRSLSDLPEKSLKNPTKFVESLKVKVLKRCDLPNSVGGLFRIVDGESTILINSNFSKLYQDHTILHEAIHFIVHSDGNTPEGDAELQAELLSLYLFTRVVPFEEWESYLKENPSAAIVAKMMLFAGLFSIAAVGISSLIDWLESRQKTKIGES